MTNQSKELIEWEKEFDEKFSLDDGWNPSHKGTMLENNIKSFIRTLLLKAHEAGRTETEKQERLDYGHQMYGLGKKEALIEKLQNEIAELEGMLKVCRLCGVIENSRTHLDEPNHTDRESRNSSRYF